MTIRESFEREKKQDRFFQELIQFSRQYKLYNAGEKVLVAASGGLDSSVLLHALYRITRLFGISLEVVHVDHKTRGSASAREGTWVRVLSERLHVPFHALSIEEPLDKANQASFRKARRELLERKARELGCHRIAMAHHATDNVETLLMRMMSGSGVYGLGSIRPITENYIRPLLWATRDDLVNYARIHNLSWIEDPTNQEDNYLRNRIRHDLIPLCDELRQGSLSNLSRLAQRVGDEEEEIEAWVASQFEEPRHVLPIATIEKFPKALQRRFFRVWLDRQGISGDTQLLEALLRGEERVHPAGSFLKRSDSWIYYNEKDFGDGWRDGLEVQISRRVTLGPSIAWSLLPSSSNDGLRSQSLSLLANFRSPLDALKVSKRVFCLDLAWERTPWPLGIGTLGKLGKDSAAQVTAAFNRHRIPDGYRRAWPILVGLEKPEIALGVVGLEVMPDYQAKTLERRVSLEHLLEEYLKPE